MTNQKGSISIHTENIFPIIKKWLYSDKDIFIRELISNGCDAVNKYKKLISLGEAKGNADENYKSILKKFELNNQIVRLNNFYFEESKYEFNNKNINNEFRNFIKKEFK